MRRLILDTNVLLSAWHGKLQGAVRVVDKKSARQSAQSLKHFYEDAVIVTPVKIEMLCGVRDAQELGIARIFLDEFEVIDAGLISKEDWLKAEQYASRAPRSGKPRDFGDCLIQALADRFRANVLSFDKGLPKSKDTARPRSPTSTRKLSMANQTRIEFALLTLNGTTLTCGCLCDG